jgi:hypothetical protein
LERGNKRDSPNNLYNEVAGDGKDLFDSFKNTP